MNTLAEYALLSTDALVKGVGITIVKQAPKMAKLPFVTIVGNSLQYDLEDKEASAQFYKTGDTWIESTPGWAQRTANLTILGGDADVDNFAAQTRSNVMDIASEVLSLKSKNIIDMFNKQAILGGTTTTPAANAFYGMLRLIAECEAVGKNDLDSANNKQVVDMSASNVNQTLTLIALDELCDALTEAPNFLEMSKLMRRKVTSLCRVAGAVTTYVTVEGALGLQVPQYNGIPIFINDHIKNNYPDFASGVLNIAAYVQSQARDATNDGSPIFAGVMGEGGLCGLQNGGLTVTPLGELETKDAKRWRIKWYCGKALFNTTKAAVLIGAKDGSIA